MPTAKATRKREIFRVIAITLALAFFQWLPSCHSLGQEAALNAPPLATSLSQTSSPEQDFSPAQSSGAEAEYEVGVPAENSRIFLAPYWDHGLRFISEDEAFNLHVGGNLQWDTVWLNGPDSVLAAPASNATSTTNSGGSLLRRARLKADGHIYEAFDYSVEYDFANAVNENKGQEPPTQDNLADSAFPCNVWVQLRDVPLFNR